MMTLRKFSQGLDAIPTGTAWYLADLGRAMGKQELFTRQSPQRLKALREHALVESAVSSNRIEGVEVEPRRVATLVFGRPSLRDRNEEEVRGYRDALRFIHEQAKRVPVSEDTVCQLRGLARGEIADAGRYKWDTELRDERIHPLILVAAFNLDFLCIHPFRDGNGRVSRLLLLLQCYHLGYEVGRYISLERLIEQNKDRTNGLTKGRKSGVRSRHRRGATRRVSPR